MHEWCRRRCSRVSTRSSCRFFASKSSPTSSRVLDNSATLRIPMVRASPRRAPFDSNSPVSVLSHARTDPSAVNERCSRARSAQGCACPCVQDASSTCRRCCRSAARPAAASGGCTERPGRWQRRRRRVGALGHHRPAARARVLSLAGLHRVLIGGRARRDAHVRVRERRRRGEVGRLCGRMRSVHVRSGAPPVCGGYAARCGRVVWLCVCGLFICMLQHVQYEL